MMVLMRSHRRTTVAALAMMVSALGCGDDASGTGQRLETPATAITATTAATNEPAPSVVEFARPPDLVISTGSARTELPPHSYCFTDGCVDAPPQGELPSVGASDRLEVILPLDGWTLEATIRPPDNPCALEQPMEVVPTDTGFTLGPAVAVGRYEVTVFGIGPEGSAVTSFEWTATAAVPASMTTLDLPTGESAIIELHEDEIGGITTLRYILSTKNPTRLPASAVATIEITAADGRTLVLRPPLDAPLPTSGSIPGCGLSWEGALDGDLARAVGGPAPFRIDVLIVLDGVDHQATVEAWAGTKTPDSLHTFGLEFIPSLPVRNS